MLAILQYAAIYLAARSLSLACVALPSALEQPVRIQELKLMYKASTQGPGGFDDAVHTTLVQSPEKYAGPLVRLLKTSEPGSQQEDLALSFIELVRGGAEVDSALKAFGAQHPNPQTRQLVVSILGAKVPARVAP